MAAGKYADAARGLPRTSPEDGAFQARVDEHKKLVMTRTPAALAEVYSELRGAKEALSLQTSDINVALAAIEQLLWEAFEDNGLTSLTLSDGASVSVQDDVSVAVEDRDALNAWARANGFERVMTLYAQTVQSATKERLLAGLPAPDGVRLSAYKKTTYRRA